MSPTITAALRSLAERIGDEIPGAAIDADGAVTQEGGFVEIDADGAVTREGGFVEISCYHPATEAGGPSVYRVALTENFVEDADLAPHVASILRSLRTKEFDDD